MNVPHPSLGAGSREKILPTAARSLHAIEGSFKLKRTSLLSILAVVAAALLPLAAASQVAPAHKASNAEGGGSSFKYDAYIGLGYTSLSQVNGSRYGLLGAEFAVTRYWGKHLGLIADGAYYMHPLGSPVVANLTLSPSVDVVLFGPVLEAKLYGHTSIFVRGLLGAEHTGGTHQTPNVSLAGGVGIGMDYQLSRRLLLRAAGDDIASSFSLINNTPQLAYSPNRTRSSRATVGIVYKF
jgi:hypothetical protein